jgi:hypothetical protein
VRRSERQELDDVRGASCAPGVGRDLSAVDRDSELAEQTELAARAHDQTIDGAVDPDADDAGNVPGTSPPYAR